MGTTTWEPAVEEIEFRADGLRLRGSLHLPAARPAPLVVGCHGLLSERGSPKQVALAQACQQRGLAYFRLDHRGCGESQGRLETDTSLANRVSDVLHAVRHLFRRADVQGPLGLFGSSMGGAVCIRAASPSGAAAIVTSAAPVRSGPLKQAFEPAAPRARLSSLLQHEFDLAEDLPNARNLLIFHGDADDVVPVAHAHELFRAASDPKRLVIQENGDHTMSDPRHQQEFIRTATLWLEHALAGRGPAQGRR